MGGGSYAASVGPRIGREFEKPEDSDTKICREAMEIPDAELARGPSYAEFSKAQKACVGMK